MADVLCFQGVVVEMPFRFLLRFVKSYHSIANKGLQEKAKVSKYKKITVGTKLIERQCVQDIWCQPVQFTRLTPDKHTQTDRY